ncbi:unnamed protein product, partial [Choristocarpus tenellus]
GKEDDILTRSRRSRGEGPADIPQCMNQVLGTGQVGPPPVETGSPTPQMTESQLRTCDIYPDTASDLLQGGLGMDMGDTDINVGISMIASQAILNRRLGNIRESLQSLKYRAESSGRLGDIHHYSSLAGTRSYIK